MDDPHRDEGPDQKREIDEGVESSSGREVKADHVGEDDEVEERDLALKGAEALLEEDSSADGLDLSGID
jgi:hypothetical protein